MVKMASTQILMLKFSGKSGHVV